MRILIVSQYFWPETFIINDLAVELTTIGHEVTIATGKPNYPSGTIAEGYQANGCQYEVYAGSIRVVRVPLRPRGSGTATELARNYLSFVRSATWHLPRLLRHESFDIVFVFAVSPITAAIPAIVMKILKRAHLAIWIQDLWPDSLEATGFVRNRLALRSVGAMVRLIYGAADTLLVQSNAFVRPIARLAAVSKIVFYPNFAPRRRLQPTSLSSRRQALMQGGFTVVFAGNLGKAQDLDTIIDAAARLRTLAPHVRFILAGDGSETNRIGRELRERGLDNVYVIGWVEATEIDDLFARADALLVTLGRTVALEATIPSKIPAYMQAGKPILGALDGEGAQLIRETHSGLVVPSGDDAALADATLTLVGMSAKRRADMGKNARRTYIERFESRHAARSLVAILDERRQTKRRT